MTSWDYFISGFKIISQKGLRRYVIAPLLINCLLFIGLIWFSIYEFNHIINWFESFLPGWLKWLEVLFWLLFVVVIAIILVYTFTIIANLVAAPFNGFLAEKVEALLLGQPIDSGNWREFVKQTPSIIWRQIQYIGYFISRAVAIAILFFIPGIQVLATPLWYVFSAWMMTVQYIDYPMDNNHVNFRDMCSQLRQKSVLNLSFGAFVMIASMIPIVNFVVIPAAVAGATHLWVEEYRSHNVKAKAISNDSGPT